MLRDNELNCQALTLFKTIYSSLLLIWRYCKESIMQHYKCTEAYSGGGLLATVPPPAYELGLAPPPLGPVKSTIFRSLQVLKNI